MMPTGDGGVCYQGGVTIKENHQMCDVTSRSKVQKPIGWFADKYPFQIETL